MSIPSEFDVRLHCGGAFVIKQQKISYQNGKLFLMGRVGRRELTYHNLMVEVKKVVGDDVSAFLWYREKGKSLLRGRKVIVSDDDINELVESRDKFNRLDVWTTTRVVPLSCIQRAMTMSTELETLIQKRTRNRVLINLSSERHQGSNESDASEHAGLLVKEDSNRIDQMTHKYMKFFPKLWSALGNEDMPKCRENLKSAHVIAKESVSWNSDVAASWLLH